jgi:hypothetical protein
VVLELLHKDTQVDQLLTILQLTVAAVAAGRVQLVAIKLVEI